MYLWPLPPSLKRRRLWTAPCAKCARDRSARVAGKLIRYITSRKQEKKKTFHITRTKYHFITSYLVCKRFYESIQSFAILYRNQDYSARQKWYFVIKIVLTYCEKKVSKWLNFRVRPPPSKPVYKRVTKFDDLI